MTLDQTFKNKEKYILLHIEGGIGKNIAATAVIRSIKKQYPERKIIVHASWPDVFLHNPNIYRVYHTSNSSYLYQDFVKNKDTLIFRQEVYHTQEYILQTKHITEAWANIYGIKLDNTLPEIFFNKIEEKKAQATINNISKNKKVCVLQCNGGGVNGESDFSWYRDINSNDIESVISHFKQDFEFIQIRHSEQPEIKGAITITNSYRNILSIISKCHTGILIDSFVQHAMAAFNKQSVVCWVGTSPKVLGYDTHINIECDKDLYESQRNYSLFTPTDFPPEPVAPKEFDISKSLDINVLYQNLLKILKNET